MNEEIKEAMMVAQSSGIIAALIHVMSPYKPNYKDVVISCFFAAISAPAGYYVLAGDGMSKFKAAVIASVAGSASSFIFIGVSKLLFAFKRDPLKIARELKK